MMAAETKGAALNEQRGFEASKPKVLFDSHFPADTDKYDVTKDGRFLIPTSVKPPGGGQITVLYNWTAGLKR